MKMRRVVWVFIVAVTGLLGGSCGPRDDGRREDGGQWCDATSCDGGGGQGGGASDGQGGGASGGQGGGASSGQGGGASSGQGGGASSGQGGGNGPTTLTAPIFTETTAFVSDGFLGYQVLLKWTDVDGASEFEVAWKGPDDTDFQPPVGVGVRHYSTVVDLPESRQHWEFRVRAVGASGSRGPWSATWSFSLKPTLMVQGEAELTAEASAVAISGDGQVAAVALDGGGIVLYGLATMPPVELSRVTSGATVRSLGLESSVRDDGVHRFLYAVGGSEGTLVKVAPEQREVLSWSETGSPAFIRSLSGTRDADGGVHALFLVSTDMDLSVVDLFKTGVDQFELRARHQLSDDVPQLSAGGGSDLAVSVWKDADGVTRAHILESQGRRTNFARFDFGSLHFLPWEDPFALSPSVRVAASDTEVILVAPRGGRFEGTCYSGDFAVGGWSGRGCFPGTLADPPAALLFTPKASDVGGQVVVGGGDLLVAPSGSPVELYYRSRTRVVLPQSTIGVAGPEGLAATAFRPAVGRAEVIRVVVGAGRRLVVLDQQF